ncbi:POLYADENYLATE-BINDING PROTEIN [Salix purpurea]|uniref:POLYADENYLATE-BINDING PROTEIN n=1 Tax=Salix purpurea TaxID=77065 RepID=A0A9Q0VUE8_SALPP|nr:POLYADENYLATE-BINDING PROTEIN [Salix purpurea]
MAQVPVQQQSVNAGANNPNFVTTSLYVGDLEANVTDSQLYDLFNQVGQVVSVRVCRDLTSRRSLGYGYVNYSNPQDAARALEMLNFTPLNGCPIRVMYSHRDPSNRKSGAGNIFIKNLDKAIDHKALHDTFSAFGNILSCKVATDSSGQSKGYGFVQFDSEEAAQKAIEKLNGMLLNDKQVYVGPFLRKQERDTATDKAQKKYEREVELKQRFEQSMKEAADKFQGANLYIKNLDDSIGDEKLKELFTPFGTITSCKVMRDPNGISRGSGFVAFSTPEEASRALLEMNGKIVVSKPLYVALAQRKEDRRARLQAQFSQLRPVAMAPPVGPRMPMYPPAGPGLGQQIFYGQAPPAIIPPQPGFGYQQQLVPGMRPGGAPMPNFFVPMVQQGQQGQRPGGRRAGAQQSQQPVQLMQQQMLPRGRVYRYPPGRGLPDVPMTGSMLPVPYDMGGMPMRDAALSQSIPVGALATALANASPDQQRTMLGENLYPLVEQLEPEAAAKVTGMLLEMDQTEVLHLLESPEALKAKVNEAMEVLRTVQQQATGTADQLASLSLNDNLVP